VIVEVGETVDGALEFVADGAAVLVAVPVVGRYAERSHDASSVDARAEVMGPVADARKGCAESVAESFGVAGDRS
jgi:hypothetical protein